MSSAGPSSPSAPATSRTNVSNPAGEASASQRAPSDSTRQTCGTPRGANALSPFSYVILTLVGEGGAGPHDIVRMMRQGRVYWTAAESHDYAEPKRLERLGYLSSRKKPGKTRQRTHYMLTGKGRQALRRWIAEPAGLPRIQHEAIVKLLAADLADDAVVLRSLGAMREDIADAEDRWTSPRPLPRRCPTGSVTCVSCTGSDGCFCGPISTGSTRSSASSLAGGRRRDGRYDR